jgi:hypothetical protein
MLEEHIRFPARFRRARSEDVYREIAKPLAVAKDNHGVTPPCNPKA